MTVYSRSDWARGANVVLGVWLFVSAFIWPHTPAQQTNTWIVGIVVGVLALIGTYATQARWINVAVAAWLLISVWVLPHQNAGTMWNNALVAIAVFLIALVPGALERGASPRRVPA